MKCPHCNSKKVESTNIGSRVLAKTSGVLVGAVAMVVHPRWGFEKGMNVSHNMCRYAEYKCQACGKPFKVER